MDGVVAAVGGVVVAATDLRRMHRNRTQVVAVKCATPRIQRTPTFSGNPDAQPVLVGKRRNQV